MVAMISIGRRRFSGLGVGLNRCDHRLKLVKLVIRQFFEGVHLLDLLFGQERGR